MECKCTLCVVRDILETLSRERTFEERREVNEAKAPIPNVFLRHVRSTHRAELSRIVVFDIMLVSRRSLRTLSNGRRTQKKPGIAD